MLEYQVAKALNSQDFESTAELYLRQLLINRGLSTEQEIKDFLSPSFEDHLHDPFLLNDMEKAVVRIQTAILNQEKVVIFSDYDCDGIPGAVVLHDFFKAVGFQNFYNYIPHRHYEGFGLSVKAVQKIITEHSPALIITIDCGTTDLLAARFLAEHKVDLIVTDHHEPKATLPLAIAVINPKVGDSYPFSGLCGAGVIFKLVQALITRGGFDLKAGQEKWWLDLVGIATIADMVPLLGENRALAYFGLKVLKRGRRPGLRQLLAKQKVDPQYLTEDDIGFTIGPRINAASRMDTPEDAFALLATQDDETATTHLKHLETLNVERKTAVAQMTRELHQRLELLSEIPPLLIMGNPNWRPSLVGLAANKLAEEFSRPAFLWGRDGNGAYKGSCRSGGGVSVVKVMELSPELFEEFGGHHASGGFTIREDCIHSFGERLIQNLIALGEEAKVKEPIMVDMVLRLADFSSELLKAQQQCAPFGCDNPKPVYLLKNVMPSDVQAFGKSQEHTKLTFAGSGLVREAIAFFRTPESFSLIPQTGQTLSMLAHLEESYFMGRRQVRLRIIDFVAN